MESTSLTKLTGEVDGLGTELFFRLSPVGGWEGGLIVPVLVLGGLGAE
jgi:hypothetical protein